MTRMAQRRASEDTYPFICLLIPFIVEKGGCVTPIIGLNIPSIGLWQKKAGFTLIELMITLTVVVILALVAGPSMNTFIKNNRITTQTNQFIADVHYAKSQALKQATPQQAAVLPIRIVVCARGAGAGANNCDATAQYTNGWLVFVDSNGNGALNAGEQTLREQPALQDRLTLRALPTDPGCLPSAGPLLAFDNRGRAVTGSGCYAVCDDRPNAASPNPAFGREIVVGVSGQIRLVSPATRCA